jgi:hypothetical protein
VIVNVTRATLMAELERLRAEHVVLRAQFEELVGQWLVDMPAHDRLLHRLAAHRSVLRQWQWSFHIWANPSD